jgi:hypothetical protein
MLCCRGTFDKCIDNHEMSTHVLLEALFVYCIGKSFNYLASDSLQTNNMLVIQDDDFSFLDILSIIETIKARADIRLNYI